MGVAVKNKVLILLGCVIIIFLIRIDFKNQDLTNRIEKVEHSIIVTKHHIHYTKNDIECLTKNIYYEAGVENDIGKYAVAHITVNRVKSKYWGDSICKVVYSPAQFSWTLKKKLPKPNIALYNKCRTVAVNTLNGTGISGLDRSLFYHANYTTPPWVDNRQYVAQIGQHIFYNRAKNSWVRI